MAHTPTIEAVALRDQTCANLAVVVRVEARMSELSPHGMMPNAHFASFIIAFCNLVKPEAPLPKRQNSRRDAARSRKQPSMTLEKVAPSVRANDVVDRLREAVGETTDAALAKHLGLGVSTVAAWRRRGSIPFEACLQVAIEGRSTFDWLMFGKSVGSPSIYDLGIELDVLAVAIEELESDQMTQQISDRWERARFKARKVADIYKRYRNLMQEATASGAMSRQDFIRMLRAAQDRIDRPRA